LGDLADRRARGFDGDAVNVGQIDCQLAGKKACAGDVGRKPSRLFAVGSVIGINPVDGEDDAVFANPGAGFMPLRAAELDAVKTVTHS